MAFTKAMADFVFAPGPDGAPTTTKSELGDEQMKNLISLLNTTQYRAAYAQNLAIKEDSITQGSITYLLQGVAGSIKEKSTIGTQTPDNTVTVFEKTFYMDSTIYQSEAIAKTDEMFLSSELVKSKLAVMINNIDEYLETGFFKSFASLHKVQDSNLTYTDATGADKKIPNLIDVALKTYDETKALSTISKEDANTLLVEITRVASTFSKASYKAAGIVKGIRPQNILIDLDSELFNVLVMRNAIALLEPIQFMTGTWQIGKIGGFTVRSNPYLANPSSDGTPKPIYGYITHGWAGILCNVPIGIKTEELQQSLDAGIYIEWRVFGTGKGSGTITPKVQQMYDLCTTGITLSKETP